MIYPTNPPPTGARQAFDDAMHKLSEALKAHQEAQNAMHVLEANLGQLETMVQQHIQGVA